MLYGIPNAFKVRDPRWSGLRIEGIHHGASMEYDETAKMLSSLNTSSSADLSPKALNLRYIP